MENEKLINFVEFYFESSLDGSADDEDIELISQELETAGIDSYESEQKALNLISQAKREVRIEKGKKFKEGFYKLLENINSNFPQIEKEEPELAIAFRKLDESPDSYDFLDDKEKMKLLEYLRNKKFNP